MNDRVFGGVRISRVLEGYLHEPVDTWFPDFDPEVFREFEPWLAPKFYDPQTQKISMPVVCWVLRFGKTTILIDSCIGNEKDRLGIPGLDRLQSPFLTRLRAAGVEPEEVDYVLCTHLHVDHVGWNTQLRDGRWVPTYPNAKYVMSKIEHDHAKTEATREWPGRQFHANIYQDSILPVVDAGLVQMVDGTYELGDNILIRPAPGHSPGHVSIELRSKGELGIFCGDIVHSPLQVPIWQWSTKVCGDRVQAAKTRREVLSFCAEHGALLIPTHFDDPHVGRIRSAGDRFGIDFGWQ